MLTMYDLQNLMYVVEAAQKCAKVAYVRPDGIQIYGHARSIGNENGGFIRTDEDVRDAYLRITTRSGMEIFLPVSELAEAHSKHLFMQYDWS
jgi:hypothetical protein